MTRTRLWATLSVLAVALGAYAALFGLQQLEETCRALNVPLGLLSAAGFFVRVNDAWHRYGLGGRTVRFGIFLVLCVVAGGSAEAFVTHAELGFRSVVMTFALAVVAVGLLMLPDPADR